MLIFSKTTNWTRPTGSCNFVSLYKNLLVLIYSNNNNNNNNNNNQTAKKYYNIYCVFFLHSCFLKKESLTEKRSYITNDDTHVFFTRYHQDLISDSLYCLWYCFGEPCIRSTYNPFIDIFIIIILIICLLDIALIL